MSDTTLHDAAVFIVENYPLGDPAESTDKSVMLARHYLCHERDARSLVEALFQVATLESRVRELEGGLDLMAASMCRTQARLAEATEIIRQVADVKSWYQDASGALCGTAVNLQSAAAAFLAKEQNDG